MDYIEGLSIMSLDLDKFNKIILLHVHPRYALPSVALVNKYSLESRPHHLAVNCNTTLLSIIDVTGLLQFVDLGQ